MRRLMAVTCIGLLALSAPVFAQSNQGYGSGGGSQSYGAGAQGNGAGNQADQAQGNGANGTGGDQGTDAFAQAPGFGNVSPFLIIGGIAGGAGLIAYAVSQNQNNETPTSP